MENFVEKVNNWIKVNEEEIRLALESENYSRASEVKNFINGLHTALRLFKESQDDLYEWDNSDIREAVINYIQDNKVDCNGADSLLTGNVLELVKYISNINIEIDELR